MDGLRDAGIDLDRYSGTVTAVTITAADEFCEFETPKRSGKEHGPATGPDGRTTLSTMCTTPFDPITSAVTTLASFT